MFDTSLAGSCPYCVLCPLPISHYGDGRLTSVGCDRTWWQRLAWISLFWEGLVAGLRELQYSASGRLLTSYRLRGWARLPVFDSSLAGCRCIHVHRVYLQVHKSYFMCRQFLLLHIVFCTCTFSIYTCSDSIYASSNIILVNFYYYYRARLPVFDTSLAGCRCIHVHRVFLQVHKSIYMCRQFYYLYI